MKFSRLLAFCLDFSRTYEEYFSPVFFFLSECASLHTASLPLPLPARPYQAGPTPTEPRPTNRTCRAVLPSAILRSVTLASHDILSHRQPHSSSVSSCEGAWDPATGGGHFKGRPAHSCSLSLQQPAPVCNHY